MRIFRRRKARDHEMRQKWMDGYKRGSEAAWQRVERMIEDTPVSQLRGFDGDTYYTNGQRAMRRTILAGVRARGVAPRLVADAIWEDAENTEAPRVTHTDLTPEWMQDQVMIPPIWNEYLNRTYAQMIADSYPRRTVNIPIAK